jgi:predicted peptidase
VKQLLFLPLLLGVGVPAAPCFAGGPSQALVPGTTFSIRFPDIPATFHAEYTEKTVGAQMTVFLPRNYDPDKRHPLLVFLNGGDGGAGDTLGVARALTEEKDFICVSVPLFKAVDPKSLGGEFIMRDPDGRYMWPFFQTMLGRLEEAVPNIATDHRVLGGFSNGAHAAQGLIDESDGEITRRFSAFLFVEGGGRLRHYELLKGKPYLMVSSSAKSRPRAEQLYAAAKAAGAKAMHIAVDVGGHDFPPSVYPAVRKWLRATAE